MGIMTRGMIPLVSADFIRIGHQPGLGDIYQEYARDYHPDVRKK